MEFLRSQSILIPRNFRLELISLFDSEYNIMEQVLGRELADKWGMMTSIERMAVESARESAILIRIALATGADIEQDRREFDEPWPFQDHEEID